MIFSGRFQAELCGWCTDLHNRAEEAGRVGNAPENSKVMQLCPRHRVKNEVPPSEFGIWRNMSAACVSVKKIIVLQCSCRLYEQLEEVKQQRAVNNRQEVYAKNRLKAKEFHQVNYLTPSGEKCSFFYTLCLWNEYFHVFAENSSEAPCQAEPAVTHAHNLLVLRKLTYFVEFYE